MPCRAHWLQLQQHQPELGQLGVKVAIVTFDQPETAKGYQEKHDLPWPLVIDAERVLYTEFDMGRASWWALLNPVVTWKYLVLWLRGARPEKVRADMHQLGGDVLVGPAGEIALVHVSKNPHDRPGVGELLDLVRGKP